MNRSVSLSVSFVILAAAWSMLAPASSHHVCSQDVGTPPVASQRVTLPNGSYTTPAVGSVVVLHHIIPC